jgi:hypothetical protein
MSEIETNPSSDDTLIRDSQLSGFSAFKERLAFCCCRLFKKTSKYDLSSASKNDPQQEDKPSYVNQAFQLEKQARKEKIEKIARSLPGGKTDGSRTPISVTQTPTRSLTTMTQGTPRSGISLSQTRPTIPTRTGISTINRPSPLAANTVNNKKNPDDTTTGFLFRFYFKKSFFYF